MLSSMTVSYQWIFGILVHNLIPKTLEANFTQTITSVSWIKVQNSFNLVGKDKINIGRFAAIDFARHNGVGKCFGTKGCFFRQNKLETFQP